MNEDFKKTQRLIKEGHSNVQDKLIEIMLELKRANQNLTHAEIMELFQAEVDKFISFHKMDRVELPATPSRVFRDKIPIMNIPYGDKRKLK